MVSKTSFFNSIPFYFPFQISQITPYLTPRAALYSAAALAVISALAYALGKIQSSPPAKTPQPSQKSSEPAHSSDTTEKPAVVSSPTYSFTLPSEVVHHPHFKNNVRAIIDFPEDSFARIAAFEDGILDRSDGICRPIERDEGTPLDETVEVIKEAFFQASSFFEETLKAAKGKLKSEDQIQFLLPLSQALTQEKALLEGVSRIQHVYQERKKWKHRIAPLALHSLYKNRTAAHQLHLQQYQSLVQTLNTSLPPLKNPELSASVSRMSREPFTQESKESLAAYCQLYCPNISLKTAEKMIEQGQTLLREILKGECTPATELKESQVQLAQITWFLTFCALKKGQGASECSFAIEEDSKLYQFLMKSPAAYQKMSSHYMGRSPENDNDDGYVMKSSVHQGVDVHNGLMPAQKRTILFGLVENFESKTQVLFFKPENFGTSESRDLLTYASTIQQKQSSDELPVAQDEKVPDAIMKAFVKLTTSIRDYFHDYKSLSWEYPFNVQSAKHTMENAKLWGIAYMYAFIQAIKSQESRPAEFDAEAAFLEATWASLDHPDKRTGREIYLTADELKTFVSTAL